MNTASQLSMKKRGKLKSTGFGDPYVSVLMHFLVEGLAQRQNETHKVLADELLVYH